MQLPIYDNLAGEGGQTNINEVGGTLLAPKIYKYEPLSGYNSHLERMIVHIADGGANLEVDTYGAIPALTNGILIGVFNRATDEFVLDTANGAPIKTNADWAKLCYDTRIDNVLGLSDSYITARWTFGLDGQALPINTDQYFGVHIRDDMSALSAHYITVRGKAIRMVN